MARATEHPPFLNLPSAHARKDFGLNHDSRRGSVIFSLGYSVMGVRIFVGLPVFNPRTAISSNHEQDITCKVFLGPCLNPVSLLQQTI